MNKRAILTIWPGTTTSNKEGKMSFEPTYEELKRAREKKVFALAGCFEPTYEELKPLMLRVKEIRHYLFWAYLWGIETMHPRPSITSISLFWAYLWGIETCSWGDIYYQVIRFEPTYEELKLKVAVGMSVWMESFEPTYEELKLTCAIRSVRYSTSFEPTYEELKLSSPKAACQ